MQIPEEIIEKVGINKLIWTKHALEKISKYGLNRDEVKKGIVNGEIIEYIWRYGYGEFYMIFFLLGKPYHVVFVNYKEKIVVKTVYIPDARFKNDYKTREDGWF